MSHDILRHTVKMQTLLSSLLAFYCQTVDLNLTLVELVCT
jgi:hypothetical protein